MRLVSTRVLGMAVIASVVYNLLLILAMHVLKPEFNPLRAPMSAYVLGAYGGWMTTSYFAMCIGLLALNYGLVTTLPPARSTRTGVWLFMIAAMAIIVAGLFPMDYPPPPRTAAGIIHALAGLTGFPTMTAGIFLFSLGFRRNPDWENLSFPALSLAIGIIAAFVVGMISILLLGFGGYAQRLFMVLFYGWEILVGVRLIRLRASTRSLSSVKMTRPSDLRLER